MKESRLHKNFTKLILEKDYKGNFSLLTFFSLLSKNKQYSLSEIKEFWKEHISKIKKGIVENKISFYIHIPFCRSRCAYCRHFYWKCNSREELDYYLKALIFKMNFFRDIFSEIKFKTLYIGGGTPSLLSERQLRNLFTVLYKNFKFEEKGEKTLECNPISSSFSKLKILNNSGINRISFGIQSTNEKILKSMNRGYENFALVKRVIDYAKKCKFKRINVDLIIGLYGDNPKTVIKSFCQIATLRPDSIALYPLQPTQEYLAKFYQNKKEHFNKDLKNKLKEFFILIKPVALRYNYFYFSPSLKELISLSDAWNFLSKEYITDSEKQFLYKYDDTERIDCFGLGTGSCSYIFGNLRYQDIGEDFYPTSIQTLNEKIYYGIKFDSLKEQKLYHLLIGLDSNKLSLRAYKKLFGSDLLEDFQRIINKLKKLNKLKIKGDLIFLTSKSPRQRFVDSLIMLQNLWYKSSLKNV